MNEVNGTLKLGLAGPSEARVQRADEQRSCEESKKWVAAEKLSFP